jgi:2-aminoadipate transaminase
VELGEIPVDAEGLDVDALEQAVEAAGRVPVRDPDVPEPRPARPERDRRGRLAELVRSRRLPVLEDDPYGLVRFEGDPLPSVFELEGGVDVMYSSSFSKTIAPGLRVGYAIVPEALASELEDLVASTYITPALLSQATVYEFLRRGLFEPGLQRVRICSGLGVTLCSKRSTVSSTAARDGTGPRAGTSSGSSSPRAPTRPSC